MWTSHDRWNATGYNCNPEVDVGLLCEIWDGPQNVVGSRGSELTGFTDIPNADGGRRVRDGGREGGREGGRKGGFSTNLGYRVLNARPTRSTQRTKHMVTLC